MRAALVKIAQSDNAIYTEDLRTLIAENAMQRDELRGNGHGAIGGAGSGRLQPPVRTQRVLVFHTHRGPHRHGESKAKAGGLVAFADVDVCDRGRTGGGDVRAGGAAAS